MEQTQERGRISWYRTPVEKSLMAQLNTRSDSKGWQQTGGYLALLLTTGSLALYGVGKWPWWTVAAIVFLHGTFFNTMSSAVHELIHRTVFKTKALNDFFADFFGFFGWFSSTVFHPSHMRHHQFTLFQPDDLEVVLPMTVFRKNFLLYGIVAPRAMFAAVKNTWRLARGKFEGQWELMLFPESEPEKRREVIFWARRQLLGHAIIIVGSLCAGLYLSPAWWLLPVLTTFATFYGGWLMMLLGTPQHIGLRSAVPDYRLCARTYTAHPFLEFLYWHMNYHIEHHMFAAVPCYNLKKLHKAIEHDLPPCPEGLAATWKQIFEIMKEQEKDPGYEFHAVLPQN